MTRVAQYAAIAACLAVAACAALPDDAPVVEQLDAETGATVTRLGHPVELYRETFVQEPTGRFAFVAPFETNQMGARELYLWVAVPVTPPEGEPLTVAVNGKPLALGTAGRAADFAGLEASPYKIPTPWSSMYYYRIDAAIVGMLGDARDIAVSVTESTKDGALPTSFAARVDDDRRLQEFAARQ
jgi:hypothetical protein